MHYKRESLVAIMTLTSLTLADLDLSHPSLKGCPAALPAAILSNPLYPHLQCKLHEGPDVVLCTVAASASRLVPGTWGIFSKHVLNNDAEFKGLALVSAPWETEGRKAGLRITQSAYDDKPNVQNNSVAEPGPDP